MIFTSFLYYLLILYHIRILYVQFIITYPGFKFATRQASNSITEEYSSKWTGTEDVYDSIITMGTDYNKNKTEFKYREILYFENGEDEEFRLVTNIFDIPAKDIISLYKQRWCIESFFK